MSQSVQTSGKLFVKSLKDQVSAEEWQARVDLAACYRLMAHFGMDDMMANHITLRVSGEEGAFLTNSYGLMYEEICASSLVKIDILHSAVHRHRPEIGCVIHTHTWVGMAVSSLACGLLPLTQTAMRFLKIAYHDYEGVVLNMDEQARLVRDLGGAEAAILRNHGLLTVGRTVGEAFNWMHRLELSCKAQLAAMACNTPLNPVSNEVLEATWNQYQPGTRRPYGVMEWPALLRLLDRKDPSFRE